MDKLKTKFSNWPVATCLGISQSWDSRPSLLVLDPMLFPLLHPVLGAKIEGEFRVPPKCEMQAAGAVPGGFWEVHS